jgi:hypothetical protein
VTLGAELVKTGLYLISGGGCNSLLRLSAAGTVLVDGKLPGTYRALNVAGAAHQQALRPAASGVIFTNHHEIHAATRPGSSTPAWPCSPT